GPQGLGKRSAGVTRLLRRFAPRNDSRGFTRLAMTAVVSPSHPRPSLRRRRSRPKQSRNAVATCPRGGGEARWGHAKHAGPQGLGKRSAGVTRLLRRFAPRNDSRGFARLAVTAVVLRAWP